MALNLRRNRNLFFNSFPHFSTNQEAKVCLIKRLQNKVFIRTRDTDLIGFTNVGHSCCSNICFSTFWQFFRPYEQALNHQSALFWIVFSCRTEHVYALYFFAFGFVPYATLSTVAKRIILRHIFETMFTSHLSSSFWLWEDFILRCW